MPKNNSPNDKRLLLLDSLRGIAAIIVLYHHVFKINNSFFIVHCSGIFYAVLNFVSGLNQEAVIFFFILSGFCIGLSLKNKDLNTSETVNEYVYRRLKRLLPLHVLALLLTFLCGVLMNKQYLEDYSLKNFIGNLFFLQTSDSIDSSWFTPYGFNGPLWSLAFEFFFYWFFLLVFFLNSRFPYKFSSDIKILSLFLLTIVGVLLNNKLFVPYLLFFNSFIIWFLGYISSNYYLYGRRYNVVVVVAFIFSLLYLVVGHRFLHSNTLTVVSKGLLMNALFYAALFYRHFINRSLLSNAINFLFYKIGKGSYAIYALHYPLLMVFAYFGINLYVQLSLLVIFTILAIKLEELSLTWKFTFLRINYARPVRVKRNYSE